MGRDGGLERRSERFRDASEIDTESRVVSREHAGDHAAHGEGATVGGGIGNPHHDALPDTHAPAREQQAAAQREIREHGFAPAKTESIPNRRSDRDATRTSLGPAIQRVDEQQTQRRRMNGSSHDEIHTGAPHQRAQRARVAIEHRDANRLVARAAELFALRIARRRDQHVPLDGRIGDGRFDDLCTDRLGERLHVGEFAVVKQQQDAIRNLGTHVAPTRDGRKAPGTRPIGSSCAGLKPHATAA